MYRCSEGSNDGQLDLGDHKPAVLLPNDCLTSSLCVWPGSQKEMGSAHKECGLSGKWIIVQGSWGKQGLAS